MLKPIKLRLAKFEAEAMRRYVLQVFEIAQDPGARNEVIVIAEWTPKFDALVRKRSFCQAKKPAMYTIPLSVARILWHRWQYEPISGSLQMVLANLDQALLNANRRPEVPRRIG